MLETEVVNDGGGNRLVNTEDRTGRAYGTEPTYGLKSNPGAQQAPAEHRTLEHPEIMLYQGRQMSIISLPARGQIAGLATDVPVK